MLWNQWIVSISHNRIIEYSYMGNNYTCKWFLSLRPQLSCLIFVFLFSFAIIMILTCKTTTEYTCLFPSLQIMHSSMERQLLPAVQYANCQSLERIDMHNSVQYCLSLQDVVWSMEHVENAYLGIVWSHAEIIIFVFLLHLSRLQSTCEIVFFLSSLAVWCFNVVVYII